MELKCPQCGKWMAVSQEELVLHDCQIVCPQCLAICHYENGALVVKDDSDAPYRHNANVSTQPADPTKYCHSCGRKLPEGISFCPYCGVDLKTPFATEPEPAPAPAVKHEEPVKQPVAPAAPKQEERAPVSRPVQDKPLPQTSHVEEKLRNIPHHYNGMHSRMHQNDDRPSTPFKVFAYAVIVLLLFLLAYIIYSGLTIEQPAI